MEVRNVKLSEYLFATVVYHGTSNYIGFMTIIQYPYILVLYEHACVRTMRESRKIKIEEKKN